MIILKICAIVVMIAISLGIVVLLGMYLWSEYRNALRHQAPTVRSYGRHFRLMKSQLSLADHASILDLGCGDGQVLRFFARYYSPDHLVGIDNNRVAVRYGRLLNRWGGYSNIDLRVGDFRDVDLRKFDVIYIFLLNSHLAQLEQWIQTSIRPDTVVVCNTFEFPHRKPSKILTDGKSVIRIYMKE